MADLKKRTALDEEGELANPRRTARTLVLLAIANAAKNLKIEIQDAQLTAIADLFTGFYNARSSETLVMWSAVVAPGTRVEEWSCPNSGDTEDLAQTRKAAEAAPSPRPPSARSVVEFRPLDGKEAEDVLTTDASRPVLISSPALTNAFGQWVMTFGRERFVVGWQSAATGRAIMVPLALRQMVALTGPSEDGGYELKLRLLARAWEG